MILDEIAVEIKLTICSTIIEKSLYTRVLLNYHVYWNQNTYYYDKEYV